MMRALWLGLAVVLASLTSCAEPEISPATGTWVFVNGEQLVNTCTSDMIDVSSGDFTLLNNGDGTFTIDPEDGSDAFLCTLEGDGAYTCPMRLQESNKIDGLDATIEVRVSATGTFSSATATKGQQDATVDCTGTACPLAAAAAMVTFPCQISVAYTASFKG